MFTEIARGRVGSAPPTRRVARPSAPSAVRKCNESDPFISTQVEKVGCSYIPSSPWSDLRSALIVWKTSRAT